MSRLKDRQIFLKIKSARGIFWFIILLVSLLALCWHSYDVTKLYFSYQTVTDITVEIPKYLTSKSLNLCFDYSKIINRTKLSQLADRKNWSNVSYINEHQEKLIHEDLEDYVTIGDIFDLTPSFESKDFFIGCQYRESGSYEKFTSNCNHVFALEKYLRLHHVCYRFQMRNHSSGFTFHEIKNHIIEKDLFFEISLNQSMLLNVTSLRASVYRSTHIPESSNVFESRFYRTSIMCSKCQHLHRLDYFFLTYYTIFNERLPPPYPTNCIDYPNVIGYVNRVRCITTCIREKVISQLGRVAFTSLVRETQAHLRNLSFITTKDLQDLEFRGKLERIEKECHQESCPHADCREVIYVTQLLRTQVSSDIVKFRIQLPVKPSLTTVYWPKLTFTDYLTYLLNCLGIWMGFSFIDLKKCFFLLLKHHGNSWEHHVDIPKNVLSNSCRKEIFPASRSQSIFLGYGKVNRST